MNALTRVPAPPLGFVTVTATSETLPAGVTAVIDDAETTFTLNATCPPTVTVAPVTKLAPEIVMVVPPAVGPDEGDQRAVKSANGQLSPKLAPEREAAVAGPSQH